jgi:hypothetical protein
MASLLVQLEAEIAAMLQADPYFSDIDVHVDPQKNIVAEVQNKISQLRFLVAPLVSSAGVSNPDEPGPVFEPVNIIVAVFGNPTYKLTAQWQSSPKNEREIAEKVHSVLHLAKPSSMPTPLYSAKNAIEQIADKTLNIYNCNFASEGQLIYQLPQAAVVTKTLNAGHYSFACATAGAAVFYTADGTWPSPRNGSLYTAPVIFDAGTTVKARAWIWGYLPSDVLTFTA